MVKALAADDKAKAAIAVTVVVKGDSTVSVFIRCASIVIEWLQAIVRPNRYRIVFVGIVHKEAVVRLFQCKKNRRFVALDRAAIVCLIFLLICLSSIC